MPKFTDSLIKKYEKPVRPYSFGSPAGVQRYYKQRRGIPLKKEAVRAALAHSDAYALHREYHKNRIDNAFYVYRKRAMIQADLVTLEGPKESKYTKKNDGVRYLLTAIGGERKIKQFLPLVIYFFLFLRLLYQESVGGGIEKQERHCYQRCNTIPHGK